MSGNKRERVRVASHRFPGLHARETEAKNVRLFVTAKETMGLAR